MPRKGSICLILLSLGFILFLIGATPATTSVADANDIFQTTKGTVVANEAPIAVDDFYETYEDTSLSIAAPGIMTNDSDVDGDAFHVTPVTMPSYGVIVLYADGSFVYTPDQNWSGDDSFEYQVTDDYGSTSNVATVTITVIPVNDAPVGQDDSYGTTEDAELAVATADGVLANDDDIESDPLVVSVVSNPSYGLLVLSLDGSFTYTPNEDFNGVDSFVYEVSDGVLSDTAIVTITVASVDDAPVAEDDSYSTIEDLGIDVIAVDGVLANDNDADGDLLFVVLVSGPLYGDLSLGADGSFSYLPDWNFNGVDSFVYEVSDGVFTDTAIVTITVTPVNDAPEAEADWAATNEDTPVYIDVLANDSDVEGDYFELGFITHLSDTHGYAEIVDLDGWIVVQYTPEPDYHGDARFAYDLYVDGIPMASAYVYVTVISVDDAPVAEDDSYSTIEDLGIDVIAVDGVLANDNDADGDLLFVVLVSGPLYGDLSLGADGSFSYLPDWNFNGVDSFVYEVSDGVFTDTATVTITVTPVNDAPEAEPDYVDTNEDTPVYIDVLANDSDVEGDYFELGFITHLSDTHGYAEIVDLDGWIVVQYTPEPDYHGDARFAYDLYVDGIPMASAYVYVTVNPMNDGPVAVDDIYTVDENTHLIIVAPGILGNDLDIDGDSLIASLISGPSHGTLSLSEDGSLTYTPDESFYGEDSFVYEVSDGALTETATVSITVVEKRPPVTTAILDRQPDSNGWYSADVIVTLSATDIESGVAATAYRYNGIPWTPYTGPFSISTEGILTLQFNSTDGAGNIEDTNAQEIWIDMTPPETLMTLEAADWGYDAYSPTKYTNGPVTLCYDWELSSAAFSGLALIDNTVYPPLYAVMYRINGGPWQYLNLEQIDPWLVGDPWILYPEFQGRVPLEAFSDEGLYTVEWYSIDIAGNVEAIHQEDFGIDLTPPELAVIVTGTQSTYGWFSSNVVVTLEAHDQFPGLIDVGDGLGFIFYYRIDGGAYQEGRLPDPSQSATPDFQYTFATEGTHTFEVWVCDSTGYYFPPTPTANFAYNHTTISIDKTPPDTLMILEAADWGYDAYSPTKYTNGPVTLCYDWELSSDALSGFALIDEEANPPLYAVMYRINGGPWQYLNLEQIDPWLVGDPWILYPEFQGRVPLEAFSDEGLYTVEWYSIDKAGNVERAHEQTFGIDLTPPELAVIVTGTESTYGWFSSNAVVTIEAHDQFSGLIDVGDGLGLLFYYRIDGGAYQEGRLSDPSQSTTPDFQYTFAAEGTHTFEVWVCDSTGYYLPPTPSANYAYELTTIKIDKTHPSTQMYLEAIWGSIIDEDGVGWTQHPVDLYYQYMLSGDTLSGIPIIDDTVWPPLYAVQYKIDDGHWIYLNGAQIDPDEYGTPTTDLGVLIETIDTDGIHTVYWYATDAAGNVERPRQFTFGIDTTPPEVTMTIDGVEGDNGWYITIANILYRATDYLTGLARTDQFNPDSTYFSYSIDSGPVVTASLLEGVDFQYAFLTEGKHLFEAWVSDNSDVSGNVNYTAVSIWIDTTSPVNSISLDGALGDNAWYTSDVIAAFSVSDALSGVGWGYFLLYDAQGSWYYSEENTYSAVGSVEVDLIASVESGEIWAWMNTSDVAGNWVIDQLAFKIDRSAPTTEASPDRPPYLDDWYISSVTVTLLSYDGFSGVSETLYSINGGNWAVYSAPIDISTEGVNTISYISTDNAGNVETGSMVVRIDDDVTPPEITLTYTGDGTDGNPGTWIVTVLDAESGVAYITVEINGVEVGTSAGDYSLSNVLGTYTINVTSSNADLDRGLLDQEKVTVIDSIVIVDDDTTGPIVTITLSESPLIPNDQDSGVWTVLVNDLESGIATMTVEINGAIVGDGPGDYPVPLLAGIHTITVTATNADLDRDSGDQEITMESATVTVYDVTAPNTTLLVGSPLVDPCITSSTSLEFYSEDGNGFGVETIKYKVNDGLWQVYDGSFYLTGDDGEYTLYYYAVDIVGNVESEHTRTFTLDNSPPATAILPGLPTHDSYITSATPISLEADDPGSGTALIRYRIDGGDWSIYTSAFELAGPDGDYMIEYYSEDQLGNTESINMVFIKLDNTAPTTHITPSGTLGDNGWFVSEVNLILTADDGTGCCIAAIYYMLDSGAMMIYAGIIEVSDDGLHIIEFWSEDNLGNLETTHGVFEFKIDKTSPDALPPVTTLEVQIPVFGADPTYISTTTGIVLEATDELSGVYKIQYRIDDGKWIDYVMAFTVDEIGSHMIYYRSIDVAGNEEIAKFIWIVVNASEVTYSGDVSGQYSDRVVLEARLIDIASQLPIVGKTVTFVLGLQSASAVTGTDGFACTTIILDQAAGVYTLAATFVSDGVYLGSSEEVVFVLEKEDAFVSYTGSTVVSSHLETFTLRATIYDEDDNYWGDLTRIYITLTIYNDEMDISSPVLVEGPHIVEMTDVEGVGVVIIETPNLPVAAYLVVVSFELEDNSYYQGLDSDTVTLTIYEPSGDFVTGSGWIWDSSGHLGHFGFIVRYRWDGTLRGTFLYVYTDDDSIVIIKATEWIGLAITDNHAFFEAKCFIVQLNFMTCEFQYSDDSYTVKVDVWDNDFDGGVDVFQMRVYDENGLIWHEAGYEPYGYLVCGNIRIYRRYY